VVNFHGSKVFRGRAGLSWNLLNGLDGDSVVLHWIDVGIDTGAWIDEEPYRCYERAVPLDLFRAQIPSFVVLAERLAGQLRAGQIRCSPSGPGRPYLPALRTEQDGWIDWRWDAMSIDRVLHAFGPPYGGASTLLEPADRSEPRRVRVGRGSIETGMGETLHPLAAGAVLAGDPEGDAIVACGRGAVRLVSLRIEGEEVPAGRLARVGMRFRGRA
jgi:methionyl-tRNA formyltransferase